MAIETFPITLAKAVKLSPSVTHFYFTLAPDADFSFVPGQFITLLLPHEEKTLKRSYSVASIPDNAEPNTIEFAAGYVAGGPASERLFNMQPGETLTASGPFGRLVLLPEHPKRYILVATSTGITPYRAMIPQLRNFLAADNSHEVIVLEGVQHREDALYLDDWLALADNYPNFTLRMHYSRETLTDNKAPYEHAGYVQTAFEKLALDPSQDVVYLCGNPQMIDDAFARLKDLGFTPHGVKREKYISR